jgi:ferredoxin
LEPLIRKHLIQRPEVDADKCRMCGECCRHCPAKAITPYAENIGFDYDRCIRCYCCVEMCPHGALAAVETGPGKALRHLSVIRDRLVQRVGRKAARRPRRSSH